MSNVGMRGFAEPSLQPSPFWPPSTTCIKRVSLTSNTTNTKTTWAPICDIPRPFDGLLVQMNGIFGDQLVDLAIGGGGPDVVIAQNLFTSGYQANALQGQGVHHWLPAVPAGTLWARNQGSSVSNGLHLGIQGLIGSWQGLLGLTRHHTFGADTSDSGGQLLDPGGSVNTFTAWVELTTTSSPMVHPAAVPGAIKLIYFNIGQRNNFARTNYGWIVEFAQGLSTTSLATMFRIRMNAHTTGDIFIPGDQGPFPVDMQAGQRLYARTQCSGADATDRLFDLVAYGLAA